MVWLAVAGWELTAYDIAAEGLKFAREAVAAQNAKINTVLSTTANFDFGPAQ